MSNNKYVIFGSGALGVQIAKNLNINNNEVIVANRSGKCEELDPTINIVKCDITDLNQTTKILNNCKVAFNCTGLPYSEWETLIPITKNLITACKQNDTVLAYLDNLYAYGDVGGELYENTPCNPTGKKGKIRKNVSELIMKSAQNDSLKMVIGRSSDFYGPFVTKSAITGTQVIKNILDNKKAMYIGRTDVLHSISYIEDAAKAMIILAEDSTSYGEVWHLPCSAPLTIDDTIKIMSKILNKEIKSSKLSYGLLSFLSIFSKDMREFKEIFYMLSKPFVINSNKFKKKYKDFVITDYDKGFKDTIAWYKNSFTQ